LSRDASGRTRIGALEAEPPGEPGSLNKRRRRLSLDRPEWTSDEPFARRRESAAVALGLPDIGIAHREEYPDVGLITGRIVELEDGLRALGGAITTQ